MPSHRLLLAVCGLTAMLLPLVLLGMTRGTPLLSVEQVLDVLAGGGDLRLRVAVIDLRLPRVLLGLLAGSALGLTGALLQDGLRNPLAGPELLGVSGGAALVVALVAILGIRVPAIGLPLLTLLGGGAAGGAVLLAGARTRDPVGMILIGAAVSTLLTGAVIAVVTLGTASDIGLFYQYLLGSLANRSWPEVAMIAPWLALGVPLALATARPLNVLRLGDDVAEGLGVPVARTRRRLFILGCTLTAAVVAACGPIGFVSLLAPHLTRRLLGTTDARAVLPVSALLGAVVLLAADQLGRTLVAPREIAAGVWTIVLGGPVLLVLLRRRPRGELA